MPSDEAYPREVLDRLNAEAHTDGDNHDLAVPASTQDVLEPLRMHGQFLPLFAAPLPAPTPVAPCASASPAQRAPPAAAATATPTTATPTPTPTPTRRPWTQEEEADLTRRRHNGESFKTIGEALSRTRAACETRAKGLGVYKNNQRRS